MENDLKRLFFAFEVDAPWPETLPKGRVLAEADRHMTVAFLGTTSLRRLQRLANTFPSSPEPIGPVGMFDGCLFLPKGAPNVVSWHAHLASNFGVWTGFQQKVVGWLNDNGYNVSMRSFLPHVTLARTPFRSSEWRETFASLPFVVKGLHLYESVGKLVYTSRLQFPLQPAFEELDHTADLSFAVRGRDLCQLEHHACYALAFKFPDLLPYIKQDRSAASLENVIENLNAVIACADQEIGCPFKAVTYSGELEQQEGHLTWEMIVDV